MFFIDSFLNKESFYKDYEKFISTYSPDEFEIHKRLDWLHDVCDVNILSAEILNNKELKEKTEILLKDIVFLRKGKKIKEISLEKLEKLVEEGDILLKKAKVLLEKKLEEIKSYEKTS
ncbi:MAG: hypothetical protein AAB732_01710 [Patescibacteria group bacterium]